ncbi:MAG: hypothetical protein EPN62_09980 [Candidimonas sp.]|nr:MAG: hypothetical protein EPN77_03450 [Candidimonas sp.]TAM23184.1 MAG: hypothetical protein EPN62_09980 [Candidimonas sp.]
MPQSSAVINRRALPPKFPTHRHTPEFWEHLGRAIASFGFLEEILAKAIFAFTATTEYSENEVRAVFAKWSELLKRALSDTLCPLADVYGKVVRGYHEADFANVGDLVKDIKRAAEVRNVLCHGSWRGPNASGKSDIYFFNKRGEKFDTPVDIEWLLQLQAHVQDIICSVIDSVTVMGWQFPGGAGAGEEIWPNQTTSSR